MPEDRYSRASVRTDEDDNRFFETTMLPEIERSPEDLIITTGTGERLDRLADRFYDDPSLWWVIAAANGLGRGDFTVPANIQLRVPQNLNQIERDLETLNQRRR